MARISVVVPVHQMKNGPTFLWRLTQSLLNQSFKDYELVLVQEGKMAENTNAGIRKATGEIIKILFLDDYFAHENALQDISDSFDEDTHWLVTGCLHQNGYEPPQSPHVPKYTHDIHRGNNGIGSPSVLSFRKKDALYFDENLSWLLDCDLYRRFFDAYGLPKILPDPNVVIGIGPHQTTHILTDEQKQDEHRYLSQKYAD